MISQISCNPDFFLTIFGEGMAYLLVFTVYNIGECYNFVSELRLKCCMHSIVHCHNDC